jgi:2-amino-4-hydroxy-6-hydroxymethyldihydropteridine diphosphokinase
MQVSGAVKTSGQVIMIVLGLGANLPSADHGSPQATLEAALAAIAGEGVAIERRSPWYRSEPVPAGDQPWYVNGVAIVATRLGPSELLALLHRVEARFGRVRRERNEPRVIDLDVLDFDARVSETGEEPVLPHPRLHERAFVLLPLRDVAPDWRHPASGKGVDELIAALQPGQTAQRI